MTDKYKLQQEDINSMDLNGDTLAKLKHILPEVFSEGADGKPSIDIERLKIALGGAVDVEADDKTRFSFNWSGKKQAQALANQPSAAALRPSMEDSKNWDNTQNVYIEGDNLEVLKLLQKSYYGQIKMIYIDPPYNTGKDFVYKDNFHDNVKNYLQLTGQVDDEGNKISTNTDKSGRYHTDWLNMMYPRLKLARNLLKDDGVIFISIDDNEVHNLRKICDEIFGEDNFITNIIWNHTSQSKNDERHFSRQYNNTLCYSRNIAIVNNFYFQRSDEDNRNYANPDNDPKGLWRNGDVRSPNYRKTLCFPIVAPNGNVINAPENGWRWSEQSIKEKIDTGEILFKNDFTGIVRKIYLVDQIGRTPENLWSGEKFGTTRQATAEIKDLFEQKQVFDTPKPKELIMKMLEILANRHNNDIILDFFSGSATTAHAVMQLNAEDGGNRKYICVQLPEATSPDSEAYKAGYKNICEIGKERIRRAGEKVLAEWQAKQPKNDLFNSGKVVGDDAKPNEEEAMPCANSTQMADDEWRQSQNDKSSTIPDIGFKVFKLDTSNIKPFDSNDMFANDLLVDGRSALDLFYELILKQGYSLDTRQCVLDIGGTKCYALVHEDNIPFVLAVLDDTVKPNFALEILKYTLTLVIVKDDCFGTDENKLNLLSTLEQLQTKDNPLQIRIV